MDVIAMTQCHGISGALCLRWRMETQTQCVVMLLLYVVTNAEVCARYPRFSSLETSAIELKLEHNVQNCLNSRSITFLII